MATITLENKEDCVITVGTYILYLPQNNMLGIVSNLYTAGRDNYFIMWLENGITHGRYDTLEELRNFINNTSTYMVYRGKFNGSTDYVLGD